MDSQNSEATMRKNEEEKRKEEKRLKET